jgi:LPS export ABC transporter protein LptC
MISRIGNKNIFSIATSIIIGVAIFVSSGCENDIKDINRLINNDTLPQIELYNFQLDFTKFGKPLYQLNAPLAKTFDNTKKEKLFPEGCILTTFNGGDKSIFSSKFSADSAVYYEGKRLEAFKYVEIINAKGDKLEAKTLTWIEKEKRFFTEDSVKITRGGEVIRGVGMEAKDDFTSYKILKTTGKIKFDDRK